MFQIALNSLQVFASGVLSQSVENTAFASMVQIFYTFISAIIVIHLSTTQFSPTASSTRLIKQIR